MMATNVLLSVFRIAPTTEVWIHVVGLIAFMLGVYAWVLATHESKAFFEASVYARAIVCMAFIVFAVLQLGPPIIVLFGVADLLGAIWTYFALKADAQPVRRLTAPNPDDNTASKPQPGSVPPSQHELVRTTFFISW